MCTIVHLGLYGADEKSYGNIPIQPDSTTRTGVCRNVQQINWLSKSNGERYIIATYYQSAPTSH